MQARPAAPAAPSEPHATVSARPEITTLRLEQIDREAGTQSRGTTSVETVARYAERMRTGDQFPPCVVFEHDGHYILADGFHIARHDQTPGKDGKLRRASYNAYGPEHGLAGVRLRRSG